MIKKPSVLLNKMRKLAAKCDEYGKKARSGQKYGAPIYFGSFKAKEWFEAATMLRQAADKVDYAFA